MTAKRKLLVVSETRREALECDVVSTARKAPERRAVRKDFLLVEAALDTDRTVVSRDAEARRLFATAARSVGVLKNIVWVDPCGEGEDVLQWLKRGAGFSRQRSLGGRS